MAGKRNRFTPFTLNFRTIQGRTTLPFVIAFLLTIGLVVGGNWFWQNLLAQKEHIIRQIQPLALETIRLDNLLAESEISLYQFLYLNDPTAEQANKEVWLISIPRQRDHLQGIVNALNDTESRLLFNNLTRYLGELRQIEQTLIRNHALSVNNKVIRYQLKNDLRIIRREADKSLNQLVEYAHTQERRIQNDINNAQTYFYLIISISVVLGFGFAYTIGVIMYRGIFAWIREVRDKLDEISYGNLPDNFRVHRNELRGITEFGNRLLDNLRALRQYANEVGQSNFGQQTKIFGSRSTLGVAIRDMGNSLQRVHDEESIRNWTTQGLAEFGEILRENSQDLDNLCREVISKLTKHLNALQGGIFVLDKESDTEPFFNLRASYAYGKHRFLTKKMSVQEGLLGRVYKEKEQVYLREIPKNYSEIVSGLGSTRPKTLLLLPLLNDDGEMQGAIELASMTDFEPYQIDFLNKLAGSIAATITIVLTSLKNRNLLEDARKMGETLRLREEEARQNASALAQNQEDTQGELTKIKAEYTRLKTLLQQLPQAVILLNEYDKILVFNHEAELMLNYRADELYERAVQAIFAPDVYAQLSTESLSAVSEAPISHTPPLLTEAIAKNGKRVAVYAYTREFLIDEDVYRLLMLQAV